MNPMGPGLPILSDFLRFQLRQGPEFRRLLGHLTHLERLTPASLAAYQSERLRIVLERASRQIPYYRDLFARLELSVESFHGPADLARIPLLDKETVRARPADFRDPQVKFTVRGYTSGTTGTPLTVWRDLAGITREHAMIWRQRGWFGVRPGDRIAVLRGDVVVPLARRQPPFWRIDRSARELLLSSHHLTPEHVGAYLDALRRFAPAALYAYPSSAAEFARLCRERRLEPRPMKAVFTASETLDPEAARRIAQVFHAPVADRYGNAERTLAGGHCEHGGYHLWTDCTVGEILPRDDHAELVGTPLHAAAMPLLRYRTGDGVRVEAPDCPCRRAFPVIGRIEGRLDDPIVLPDGRRIGRLDHIWKGIEHVAAGQIVQEADLSVHLRLIPDPGFSSRDREQIEHQARARLGADLPLTIEEVDRLPRTASGKFLAVISHVAEIRDSEGKGDGENSLSEQ